MKKVHKELKNLKKIHLSKAKNLLKTFSDEQLLEDIKVLDGISCPSWYASLKPLIKELRRRIKILKEEIKEVTKI